MNLYYSPWMVLGIGGYQQWKKETKYLSIREIVKQINIYHMKW